ncbi:MAG: hypothetical protein WC643_00040 [Parcubacteria group bacterium]|jgi:hypothetical protein
MFFIIFFYSLIIFPHLQAASRLRPLWLLYIIKQQNFYALQHWLALLRGHEYQLLIFSSTQLEKIFPDLRITKKPAQNCYPHDNILALAFDLHRISQISIIISFLHKEKRPPDLSLSLVVFISIPIKAKKKRGMQTRELWISSPPHHFYVVIHFSIAARQKMVRSGQINFRCRWYGQKSRNLLA